MGFRDRVCSIYNITLRGSLGRETASARDHNISSKRTTRATRRDLSERYKLSIRIQCAARKRKRRRHRRRPVENVIARCFLLTVEY